MGHKNNRAGTGWLIAVFMPLILWLILAVPAHADVIYTVEEGDSAWSIAIEFGVSLEDLFAANAWAEDENPMLRIGQRIAIPSDRDEESAESDSGSSTETTYIVQPGDNPFMIAHRFGIGTLNLLEFNNLTEDDLIQPGQMLSIPPTNYQYEGNAETAVSDENSGPAPEPLRYRVQSGDSPWTIARQFGINVQTVLSFNNLTEGALLHIGDELLIPADFGTLQSRSSSWERYIVVQGDTLGGIASRNNVSLAALTEANNLSPESLLREGTELVIPAYRSAPIIEATPPEVVPPQTELIVPGPTQDYSQELTPLQPINPVEPIDQCTDLTGWHSEIFDFSQITPPELATPDPTPVTDDGLSADGSFDDGTPYHTYTVRRGDTISEVAHAFGITQSDLMDRNGLDIRTSLRIGRDLRIPLPRPATPPPSHNPGSQQHINYGAPDVPIGDGSGTGTGQSVIQEARKYLGTPYVWSGTSLTGGIDCSGFTMQVYAMFGISLPHRAAEQAQCGTAVDYADLQPGDLVLFHTTRSGISHVGMYIGSGDFIHSSSHMGGVVISPLDSGYYNERFVCARRVL